MDHIAISRTFSKIFDHPVQVLHADGTTDLEPGIQICQPSIPESSSVHLTDHLPVVLTLRTTSGAVLAPQAQERLSIVAALPNPHGSDEQFEAVRLRNHTSAPIALAGWKIGDSTDNSIWVLNGKDGDIAAGATIIIVRRNRPMNLNNSGCDTIGLLDDSANVVDQESYGDAPSGQLFQFD